MKQVYYCRECKNEGRVTIDGYDFMCQQCKFNYLDGKPNFLTWYDRKKLDYHKNNY